MLSDPKAYRFRQVSLADLPHLRAWLQTPEVVRWWGDPAEQLELTDRRGFPRPIGSGRSLWRICRACAPGYRRRRSCVGGAILRSSWN
jgi:hypothetical protein